MSSKQDPTQDEQLLTELRAWKVDAPLPPRFEEAVWRRIAKEEARMPERGIAGPLARYLRPAFMRPQIAWTYATVLLTIGALAGGVTAQVTSSRTEATLGSRYVQSIDPYSAAGTGGSHSGH